MLPSVIKKDPEVKNLQAFTAHEEKHHNENSKTKRQMMYDVTQPYPLQTRDFHVIRYVYIYVYVHMYVIHNNKRSDRNEDTTP